MSAKSAPTKPKGPRVVDAPSLMSAITMAHRSHGATIGFVPTMGALHAGHEALLREARLRADVVVASVFVNPLQFNDPKDLAKYPRTLDDDLAICAAHGVDVVYAPTGEQMYPPGFDTRVIAGALGHTLEGRARPGHFDGMLTVVLKLFQAVDPHFAVFGEKDYQQLQLVRRMVRDFHLHVEIVPIPVIRDTDGLALSSRNARLAPDDRKAAVCLSRALLAAQDTAAAGERRGTAIVAAARKVLGDTPRFTPDYVACVDARTLEPVKIVDGPTRLLLAGTLGKGAKAVRLIDNGPLFPGIGTPAMPSLAAVAETARARGRRESKATATSVKKRGAGATKKKSVRAGQKAAARRR